MGTVRYEWDEAKREANRDRHGVDFTAVAGFDWTLAIINRDARFAYGELRFSAHGPIDGRLHVLVFTQRDDATRIISLRKANRREQAAYEATLLARLARR